MLRTDVCAVLSIRPGVQMQITARNGGHDVAVEESDRRMVSDQVQAALAGAWGAACAVTLAATLPRLDAHSSQIMWTFLQPLAPPLLMLWLWAQAVGHFERRRIPYAACFPEPEQKRLPPAAALRRLAAALTLATATGAAACALLCASAPPALAAGGDLDSYDGASGRGLLPLLVPPLLYAAVAVLLATPAGPLPAPARRLFGGALLRVLAPLRPVAWSDFLLADVMTSLAKSTGDAARAACLIMHGPWSHPASGRGALAHGVTCGPLSWHAMAFQAAAPAARLTQCAGTAACGGARAQALNALKYASSIPALILTAMEHEAHKARRPFPYRQLWLAVMVVNTAYSYYWDVEQDWGMPWLVKPGAARLGPLRLPRPLPRGRLYRRRWYCWLLGSNLLLRLSWAHRLVGDLEAHDAVLLAVALLEVARRWQWAFVRFEVELRGRGLLPDGGKGHRGEGGGGEGGGGGDGWAAARGAEGARVRAAARSTSGGAGSLVPDFGGGGGGGGGGGAGARVHAAALWASRSRSGGRAGSLGGDLESGGVTPAASSGGEGEGDDAAVSGGGHGPRAPRRSGIAGPDAGPGHGPG
ncbi:MAG: EXS family-domain-containing protein [Monoraphidium minutum]|nr:MAG: EXS family-domain-containing protein [Monoraphidium minutum]